MPYIKTLKTNYVISKKKGSPKWLNEKFETFISFVVVAIMLAVAFYFIFALLFWFVEQYALLVS